MKEKIGIATIKSWNIENALRFKESTKSKYSVTVITKKEELDYSKIRKSNLKYIFFPHWSWKIPKKIYKDFECIVFHMTNLPFGRGGSPLQNLITRGIKTTKISAFRVVRELDAGPIYLKKPLSLKGSAEEIYKRASRVIFKEMIPYIIKKKPSPIPQKGEVVVFKRRKPEQSKIPDDIGLGKVYDYIRMFYAEGYPPAFLKTKKLIFEFKKAQKKKNLVKAEVYIKEKNR